MSHSGVKEASMRVRTLVASIGAILIPLGVFQNFGAVSRLTTPYLPTASYVTSAYAAYDQAAFLAPPSPPVKSAAATAAAVVAPVAAAQASTNSALPAAVANTPVVHQPPPEEQLASWLRPERTALSFNDPGKTEFARTEPRGTTLHFTFGTNSMIDFVNNWSTPRARVGTCDEPHALLLREHLDVSSGEPLRSSSTIL